MPDITEKSAEAGGHEAPEGEPTAAGEGSPDQENRTPADGRTPSQDEEPPGEPVAADEESPPNGAAATDHPESSTEIPAAPPYEAAATEENIEFTDTADAGKAPEPEDQDSGEQPSGRPTEAVPGDDEEYVEFTDTADGDPAETDEDGEQSPASPSEDEAPAEREAETPEAPTSESLSFHIHRNLASGRATLAVSSSATDPFYRTVDRLESLEDALPMMAALHQEARAHWEDTPRYPSSAGPEQGATPRPAAPRPAPRPAPSKPTQQAAQTQQASLF